jgi:DNA-binding LytR/AlgR family response regulator
MAVKILIVEDEVLVAENLAADLTDLGFEVTDLAISADECFAAIDKLVPDVVLMDIQIKGKMNGIEVVERLNEQMSIAVIYLTSNTDSATMQRAIATKPKSFISKPYNLGDLQAAIEIAFQIYNDEPQNEVESNDASFSSVFVKSGEFYHRINLDDVLYVQASGSYCTITTDSGEFVLSMNLQNFINKVPRKNFVRVHRSFVANIQHIEKFDNNSIVIHGKELPISKSYREKVFKNLQRL